jgi:hypothetical protein
MIALSYSQAGLLMDMVGFVTIAGPALFWNRRGIPFLPMIGESRWWLYFVGVLLIFFGFVFQFAGVS